MSDFKTRLQEEKDQLSERTAKLSTFVHSENFSKIDEKQQKLLTLQLPIMSAYEEILKQRLDLL